MVIKVKENFELLEHIYQDSEMSCFSISDLLERLKEKDNKIKKDLEDILHKYEYFKEKTYKILKDNNQEIEKESSMVKWMAKTGIKKEVKSDNSDSSIADMLIKGISSGSIDMEKKISDYKDDVDKKYLDIAKDFLKFQEDSIEALKKYL